MRAPRPQQYGLSGTHAYRQRVSSPLSTTTTTTSSRAFAESYRSPPPPPPYAAGTPLEHHRAYSPHRRSMEGIMSLPRPPHSPASGPPGTSAGNAAAPPALPPLGAGPSGSSPPGPVASSTSPGRSAPPPPTILPPLRTLDSPHRPSLPPPLPLPPSHSQPPPSLPPPPAQSTLSPHRPPPPHLPYDANHHYARGRSTSPPGPPRSMGSHIPPPQQHHQPPPHHAPPHHGMSMQHGPPPPGYYGQPPPPPPHGYGPPHHHHGMHGMDPNAYRMPLPAPMGGMPQHRPSKKEIKRRTKTGCLTCRKRRIKCDEGHPTCRNCEKSKRECLGYDPIFKAQSQPSSIQAAPNATGAASRPPPAPHAGYPPNSQPYMAPPNHAYPPQMPPGQPMPPPGYGEFNQTAIDPKLEQAEAPIAAPTAIEHLLDLGNGRAPPSVQRTEPLSETELTKAKEVYQAVYAPGLDKFFDLSDWFTVRSWEHIVQNTPLVEKFALLESRFNVTADTDAEANMANQSLEGHILWDIMQLCRQVASGIDSADTESPDVKHGVRDAAKRIRVFETLLTHQKLSAADVIPAPTPTQPVPGKPALELQMEERRHSFWHHVSKFCTLKIGDPSSAAADSEAVKLEDVDMNLNEIRQLLDSYENRDILYSIAIVSHYMRPGGEPVGAPTSNSDSDGAGKVSVARVFLQREAMGGTFQVAKVVGGMVLRSWKPKDA